MSTHHHHKPASESGGTPPSRVPYWKRAHTDWRLWVGGILMLSAMIIYIMTMDLSWRPRAKPLPPHHPQQPSDVRGM